MHCDRKGQTAQRLLAGCLGLERSGQDLTSSSSATARIWSPACMPALKPLMAGCCANSCKRKDRAVRQAGTTPVPRAALRRSAASGTRMLRFSLAMGKIRRELVADGSVHDMPLAMCCAKVCGAIGAISQQSHRAHGVGP